jgi:hypothetical protein
MVIASDFNRVYSENQEQNADKARPWWSEAAKSASTPWVTGRHSVVTVSLEQRCHPGSILPCYHPRTSKDEYSLKGAGRKDQGKDSCKENMSY